MHRLGTAGMSSYYVWFMVCVLTAFTEAMYGGVWSVLLLVYGLAPCLGKRGKGSPFLHQLELWPFAVTLMPPSCRVFFGDLRPKV
jgi:hypothetical protein